MSDEPRAENPEEEVRLTRPPAEGIRAVAHAAAVEQTPSGASRMSGHFARFNVFNEIDSAIEGRFLERIAPGAFNRTFKNNGNRIRMLFQHGRDPVIGDKPIGVPDTLREDDIGPYFEGDIFPSVPPLVVDGLRAGQYGISYRFNVVNEDWEQSPKRSDFNPLGLPQRTIREAKVFEFGPVTFPADSGADYAVRSITLTDLDAALAPPETAALPDGPEAEVPHSDAGTRADDVEPPTVEKPIMEYVTIDEKLARDRDITDELKRMAAEYTGVMPESEQATWDGLVSEQDSIRADIAAWELRQERIKQAEERGSVEAPPKPAAKSVNVISRKTPSDVYDIAAIRKEARSADEVTDLFRDNALRSLEQASKRYDVNGLGEIVDRKDEGEEGKGEIARRILLTGSPAYRSAWTKYLRGERDLWTPEEARAAALAVTGTTTTGGYAVPYVFDPTMLRIGSHVAVNAFRSACRIETITNGNNWRTVTVGAITAAYGTEASAASEGGPTFGQPTYTVQTAKAFATVSIETMQDRPDIADELTKVFGEAKDNLEASEFATGTGLTVYPLGMFTDTAYTNKDTATNDVTAITDMTALEGDLPIRHRMNAAFFMSRSTLRQLEALDTTGYYFKRFPTYFAGGQAQPANVPSGASGTELLGYPVYEVPGAASTLTTDGAIIVVFADPKSYVIVDRIGMNVEVIPQMLNGATPSFPTLQRGVICYWRNTAKPINADAGRSLSVQ